MPLAKTFEELGIWQSARSQVKAVYSAFRPGNPGSRDYGFRDQIQRAGLSVMNNIAEGFERRTDADFLRFLDISKGSCGEVRSMLYVAEDLGYVAADAAACLREAAVRLSKGIGAFSRRIQDRIHST